MTPHGRLPASTRVALAAAVLAVAGATAACGARGADMLDLDVERDGQRYFVDSRTLIRAPVEDVFAVLTDYDRLHELTSVFDETRVVERSASGLAELVYLRARGCVLFFCRTIERYDRLALDPPHDILATAVSAPGRDAGSADARRAGSDGTGATRAGAAAAGEDAPGEGARGRDASRGDASRGDASDRDASDRDASDRDASDRESAGGTTPYARSHWRLKEVPEGTEVIFSMEMEPDFWVPPLIGPWALKRKLASGAGDAADRVEQRALGQPVALDD